MQNSIICQFFQALMKIRTRFITINIQVNITKMTRAQESKIFIFKSWLFQMSFYDNRSLIYEGARIKIFVSWICITIFISMFARFCEETSCKWCKHSNHALSTSRSSKDQRVFVVTTCRVNYRQHILREKKKSEVIAN